jgi:hypothetical protein
VNKAIIPAKRKAKGVPPLAKETANPKTAKIHPPTIPPIPMAIASFSFIVSEDFLVAIYFSEIS